MGDAAKCRTTLAARLAEEAAAAQGEDGAAGSCEAGT